MTNNNKNELSISSTNKFANSNAAVDELRTAIFAPVLKLTGKSRIRKELEDKGKLIRQTPWGKITIEKTILTQLHRNILDCILSEKTDVYKTDTKTVVVKFSANKVLKKYSITDSENRNTKWLEEKIKEMMTSIISITFNNKDKFMFTMIEAAKYIDSEKTFFIEFSKNYVEFFEKQTTIGYNEYLDDILELKSPLLQAVARLLLSHEKAFYMPIYDKNSKSTSTGILESVGEGTDSDRSRQRAIKEIKDNAGKLEKFGIYLTTNNANTKVSYKKVLNIKFIPKIYQGAYKSFSIENQEAFLRLIDLKGAKIRHQEKIYEITDFEINTNKVVVLSLERDNFEKINENDSNKTRIEFDVEPIEIEEIINKALVLELEGKIDG